MRGAVNIDLTVVSVCNCELVLIANLRYCLNTWCS